MGLLDDAIREHLDLQRRRGADPAEIERVEREALGPVRRNREPVGDTVPVAEPQGDSGWGEPVSGDHPEVTADETFDRRRVPLDDPSGEDELFDDDEPFAGSEPFADPPPVGAAGQETSEFSLEEALAAEDPGAAADEQAEDVLEETPEFLQDTPDHDRLWFEQRPPRDFDFDS